MTTITPFPFQEEGARWLVNRHRALLFDAPGLGKTIQIIKAAEYAGFDRLDVVAPASVRTQWVKVMADNSTAEHQAAYSYNHARDKPMPRRMGVLGLDEAHALKGRNSGRTLALYGEEEYGTDGIIYRAERVWVATGTPMPKDASDLYPLMRAVVPGSLWVRHRGIMDFWSFMKRYCSYYNGPFGIVVNGHKNQDELRDRLAPFMLRRLKRDVMKDWIEPIVDNISFDVGAGLRELLKMEGDENSDAFLVAKTVKRHGIAGLAAIANEQSATIRRFTGMLLIGPIGEWLADKFDNGEKKIVVVAFHREVIEGIQKVLKKRGYDAVVYWGGMTEKQKDKAKHDFINDKKKHAFIGQIIAAGTGLDGLQAVCERMLLAEYSWIATENEQAIGRLDRIGKCGRVLAEFAGIAGSVHERITEAFTRRARESEELFG
jgi:SNF2 family DNA or RNA helicase